MSAPPLVKIYRIPFLPAVGALTLFWLSLTPSLLPRPALFQGLLCAIAALLGYALGALAGWLLRSFGARLTGPPRHVAWWVFGVVGGIGTLLLLIQYLRWQRELRQSLGVELITVGHLTLIAVSGGIIFGLFLLGARAIRGLGRISGRAIGRLLPPQAAVVGGGLVAALLVYAVIDSFVFGRLSDRLDTVFVTVNREFSTDLPAPASPYVSGGPDSLVSWDNLGRQGRVFISNAPSQEAVSDFIGAEASAPIRAYVGIGSDGEIDLPQQARLAAQDLERMGAFDRQVINVVTGTGRGWINENQAKALEYMWAGDVATVSIQYSYLPSWLSFLVDGDRAQDAGRLLFEEVYAIWSELPEDERPYLVVSGESLGSFGGEAAFAGSQDLALRTSGGLFVGPTGNNTLWTQVTAERDEGTPEYLPIYDGGAAIRFSPDGTTWDGDGDWEQPRLGYLQHANDPVTWFNWSLAFHRPDWLVEDRGPGVHPDTTWIPVITLLQVAADQMVAMDVGPNQGHDFGFAPVHAWAQILPPPDWTEEDTQRLIGLLAQEQPQRLE